MQLGFSLTLPSPILFFLPLRRVFYQTQGNPLERDRETMSSKPSPKLQGRYNAHPHQDDKFQVPLAQGTHTQQLWYIPGTSPHPILCCNCWQISTSLLTLPSSRVSLTEQQPVGAVSSRISHVETADRKTGVISEPSM